MHVLILGGTADARQVAHAVVGTGRHTVTLSLAGQTRDPAEAGVATRVGGFGGSDGLAEWACHHAVDAILDVTHPFAVQISHNAVRAATDAGVPLARFERAAWAPQPGDRWVEVADFAEAASAARRYAQGGAALLTVGRRGLEAFAARSDVRWIVRSVEPPSPDPGFVDAHYILDRGPFTLAGERGLMAEHAIDVVVSKASGGSQTQAKLDAARERGIPVVLIRRPPDTASGVPRVSTPQDAVAWLDGLGPDHSAVSARSGVSGADATKRGV